MLAFVGYTPSQSSRSNRASQGHRPLHDPANLKSKQTSPTNAELRHSCRIQYIHKVVFPLSWSVVCFVKKHSRQPTPQQTLGNICMASKELDEVIFLHWTSTRVGLLSSAQLLNVTLILYYIRPFLLARIIPCSSYSNFTTPI
jgi:hypothetical protein